MRKLTYLVIIAVTLWGGYWFVGSTALERGVAAWFDQRRAEGWQADYTDLYTRGFPNRFDTTVEGLALADPNSGLAWTAPFFQFFALSYKPGHIIAIWPNDQVISTPEEKITVTSSYMRASVVFNETTDLNLNRTTLEMTDLGLTSDAGWSSKMQTGLLAMRQADGGDTAYQLHFEAKGVTPASEFIKRFEGIAFLTDVIDGLTIDADLRFDAPWDRFAVERARPQITYIDLDLLQATWGELDLRLAGELTVDENGTPEGQITVKAKNWREMLMLANQSGLLPSSLMSSAEKTLSFLASLSGDKTTLDTPLTFRNGYIAFGPIPLGPAPSLRLR